MRTRLVICLMAVVRICVFAASGLSVNNQDTISYPPKPPETTTMEMVNAGKGLVKETNELGTAIVQGVKDDGGIIATVKKHKKFYSGIFIFGLLTLIWMKNRTH